METMAPTNRKIYTAVNWNKSEDMYSLKLWEQNTQQFWLEKEIPVSDDKDDWDNLTEQERIVYQRVLAGLTLLDTRQGGNGMPLMTLHAPNDQQRAVFAFMGAMEEVHAKSYSHIFQTLMSKEQIDRVYDWVHGNPFAQRKADLIIQRYNKIFSPVITNKDLYLAMVASVFLESFLFYSGFFFPVYLSGQGRMTASGEIIGLILRDEALHGAFTGVVAQEVFEKLSAEEQVEAEREVYELLEVLYQNEILYTDDLYTEIGLTEEVLVYIRYNANRALMNLGLDPYFDEEAVNPIVLNGIQTDTIQHDFFSTKGNGYVVATNVQPLKDNDFAFPGRL